MPTNTTAGLLCEMQNVEDLPADFLVVSRQLPTGCMTG